jgi:hypothetical protein
MKNKRTKYLGVMLDMRRKVCVIALHIFDYYRCMKGIDEIVDCIKILAFNIWEDMNHNNFQDLL